jgi:hypothetical protein
MRLVDPPAHRGYDLVDDPQEMRLVLEAHPARLEHAAALHIDVLVTIDQNVADGGILEHGLERTQPGHFVQDFGNEIVELLLIERETLDQNVLSDELLYVGPDLFLGQAFKRLQVDFLDQPAVKPDLGIQELVALEQIRIGSLEARLGCGLWKDGPGYPFKSGRRLLGRNKFRSHGAFRREPTDHVVACRTNFRAQISCVQTPA